MRMLDLRAVDADRLREVVDEQARVIEDVYQLVMGSAHEYWAGGCSEQFKDVMEAVVQRCRDGQTETSPWRVC